MQKLIQSTSPVRDEAPDATTLYVLRISGTAVEATCGHLSEFHSAYWLNKPANLLYNHTFKFTDDFDRPNDGVAQEMYLPEWRDIADCFYLDAANLAMADFYLTGGSGKYEYGEALESCLNDDSYFEDKSLRTVLSPANRTRAIFTGSTYYEGNLEYEFSVTGEFDPALLRIGCVIFDEEEVITSVIYDDKVAEPKGGTGPYYMQVASLRTCNDRGKWTVLEHREDIDQAA